MNEWMKEFERTHITLSTFERLAPSLENAGVGFDRYGLDTVGVITYVRISSPSRFHRESCSAHVYVSSLRGGERGWRE